MPLQRGQVWCVECGIEQVSGIMFDAVRDGDEHVTGLCLAFDRRRPGSSRAAV